MIDANVSWRHDLNQSAWLCSDGRVVTDRQLAEMEPFVSGMILQVLNEGSGPVHNNAGRTSQ